MFTARDKKGHTGTLCMTLIFKVNDFQGHVIYFCFFVILDLENVEIDTKIIFAL